jgi:purine-binding chemotaxis protein CheW
VETRDLSLHQLQVFSLDDQRYALELSAVVRAVRMVAFTSTPNTSELVMEVVNVQGHIVPVINARKRCGLPEREIELDDFLIVGRSKGRMVGLVVNEVQGIVEYVVDAISSEETFSTLEYVAGVAKLPDGIVLILNLDKFVSQKEAEEELEAFQVEEVMQL